MKKRILLYSLLVSLGALVLFAIFSTFTFHSKLIENTTPHLQVYMLSYKQNAQKFAALDKAAAVELSVEVGGARVTIIALDGTVLADSHLDAAVMENHGDRAEVIAAIKSGSGSASRGSKSIKEDYIYYCELFDNTENAANPRVLIRIAQVGSSVFSVLTGIIPLLAVFAVLVAVLCVAFSNYGVKSLLKPIEEFGARTVETDEAVAAPYPELENVARILGDYKRTQEIILNNVKAERLRETVVLDNMEHCIIILKAIDEVVLINKAAAKLLDYDAEDKVIYSLARDRELYRAIENRESGFFYRTYSGEEYSVRMSFVSEMDAMVALITCVGEIRRAERTKNEFIANVTHEMNTPLTAIGGFAELIASGKQSPSAAKKNAEIIMAQSAKLGALIKSILNYSAIESESAVATEIDLAMLATAAADEFTPAAAAAEIKIIKDIQPSIMVAARENRLREVINNFISNAIRYNVRGGSVTVSVGRAKSGRPLLTVSDTGIGIATENQKKVFDRFFTVDTSHSSGGFGLGLAIVKKLAAINGWTLVLSSEPGKGTQISVEFT